MFLRPFMRASVVLLTVAALAAPAVHAQTKQVPVRRAPDRKVDWVAGPALNIQGFSVVLVVGSTQGTDASEGVPAAARKALADMKDFLPYKRYQLIDAAWMLCCASFQAGPVVSGRMRGPDHREYSYSIEPIGAADGKLNLRFGLREVTGTAGTEGRALSDTAKVMRDQQLHEAVREAADATLEMKAVQQRYEAGLVPPTDYERARLRVRLAEERVTQVKDGLAGEPTRTNTSTRGLIDSTFAVSPGETVVIGTSRVMGDQALIAVLTAATRPAPAR